VLLAPLALMERLKPQLPSGWREPR